MSVHQRRVTEWPGEYARVAFVVGCPAAVFRYHPVVYFEHYWTTRAWTLFDGATPTVLDVTDQVPGLLAELFAGNLTWPERTDRWLHTRVCVVDGQLVPVIGPPCGPDVTWNLYGRASLWPFNNEEVDPTLGMRLSTAPSLTDLQEEYRRCLT